LAVSTARIRFSGRMGGCCERDDACQKDPARAEALAAA
jgi:hypothetical protein